MPFNAVSCNRPLFRELSAFLAFAESRQWARHDLSGLFSPRCLEKLGVSATQFNSFVTENPGFDVYLFHPFPRERLIANHFMELAELEHPGITSVLSSVWDVLFGRYLPIVSSVDDADLWCHCNYFLGSRRFWQEYSVFIQDFMRLMESKSELAGRLLELTPYSLSKTSDDFLPLSVFVFERSLTHFLADRNGGLRVANFFSMMDSWKPPELFAGEESVVNDLLQGVNQLPLHLNQVGRELAVSTYYFRRKLGVIGK